MVTEVLNMAGRCADAVQSGNSQRQEGDGIGVVEEMLFSSEEHQTSFEQLTSRQKQYLLAYMQTGSPSEVAKELGLSESVKGVGKRLSQIAKAMGLSSIKDLKPSSRPGQSATSSQLMEVLKKQKFRCALSGTRLVPETSQLDHIEPLAEDGTNDITNLQWLDAKVNKAKGTMSQAEFVRMCVDVARFSGKLQ